MLQPRLAGRYAKSLIDLAMEQNQLEAVYADMIFLRSVCRQSREFVTLMRSPVINADKKNSIVDAITRDKVGRLTTAFNKLLIQKGRESILPEIVNAFIDLYNAAKGIHKVKLATAEPVSEALKKAIEQKVKTDAALPEIELETVVKEELIGGFVLEFDNKLVDASILRDLKDIQKQFRSNIYVKNIR
ncbi:ATP synthase F1 subunit delta [Agriterribacter sp.]|uniref:ATP synthase F1 subunit delta n=1 Tax=Agriterribacter sp. TaxID=2821509 RepID=UPI002C0D81CB|nr:ATP synthase F1 subunit delta [Agriterribacter sp.]HRP55518.1 ATP synthase F1 subunit delta [Agriterribacter sp.]